MTPEEHETVSTLEDSIKRAAIARAQSTGYQSDTLSSFKSKFDGKRAIGKEGEDHGTIQIRLDQTNHVEAVLGGHSFPVSLLQDLVDDGSLVVRES